MPQKACPRNLGVFPTSTHILTGLYAVTKLSFGSITAVSVYDLTLPLRDVLIVPPET
jgi:hypothetical protein